MIPKAPDTTQFYITDALLNARNACYYQRTLFRRVFKVRKNSTTPVFLTYENFKKAHAAGMSLSWLRSKAVWSDAAGQTRRARIGDVFNTNSYRAERYSYINSNTVDRARVEKALHRAYDALVQLIVLSHPGRADARRR